MEDVPMSGSSLLDVNLDWVLAAANERFARHGAELFRVRTLALKGCSLVGFAGVLFARALQTTSKTLAIAVLAAGVAPAIACAPGRTRYGTMESCAPAWMDGCARRSPMRWSTTICQAISRHHPTRPGPGPLTASATRASKVHLPSRVFVHPQPPLDRRDPRSFSTG